MPKRKKVKSNYRHHAKIRALQRFDIDLTKKVHDQIVKEIQAGGNNKHQFEETLSNGRSIWKIQIFDSENRLITVRAVYSKSQKSLVTILPEREKRV